MNWIKKFKEYRQEWEDISQQCCQYMNQTEYKKNSMLYVEALETKKVDPDMVLYESFWGRGMIDNPYALFLELLTNEKYKKLKHVWILSDFEDNAYVLEKYKKYDNVRFVEQGSSEYFQVLAQAKYLVNNTTFPPYFVKRREQIYINTWHGTPLKSMGYEMTGGNIGTANTIRNFLSADYLLSANDTMTRMYLRSYKLQNLMPGEIIEEGYPRNDFLLNTKKEEMASRLKLYGIELEKNKKIIMYAPTWREADAGKAVINPDELLSVKEYLENHIDKSKYQILIKPHQYVYRYLKDLKEYKGLLIPATIDANEILSVVDILISDYSSIFLDYMVLGRPVLFYIPDLAQYQTNRGLDVKPEDLPGPYSANLEEVAGFIRNIEQIKKQYQGVYDAMRARICAYDDGKVSERIADIVWGGQRSYRKVKAEFKKKRLLIYIGALPENGIVHSFMSLLKQINYDEWDVTAMVVNKVDDPAVQDKINSLDSHVRVIVKCGNILSSLKDLTKKEFLSNRALYRKVWDRLYPWQVMRREFDRCFGMAEFDYIVDFQGYSLNFTPVLAVGRAKKKSIWLHNDMEADMNKIVNKEKVNYRFLNFVISLYPKFDHMVSCSRAVMKVNREKLSTSATYDKFTYAKNTVNAERIEACLREKPYIEYRGREYLIKNLYDEDNPAIELLLVQMPQKDTVNFVTMGRMSTEKNHIALVRAFAKLHRECPSVRLFILGNGPLRGKIEQEIALLGMEEYVTLTGNIRNPFAVMKRCSCFVLPSLHEGQPMVLLEARRCGLPIIVSDFSTVSDSLYPDGQLLIGTDEESIYKGLKAFVNGEVPTCEFDMNQYNQEAYQEFINAIQ